MRETFLQKARARVRNKGRMSMADSLDELLVLGKDDFHWIDFARTYEDAVIRKHGEPGIFLVHSQTTGRRTFFRAGPDSNIVQLPGPPLEEQR